MLVDVCNVPGFVAIRLKRADSREAVQANAKPCKPWSFHATEGSEKILP